MRKPLGFGRTDRFIRPHKKATDLSIWQGESGGRIKKRGGFPGRCFELDQIKFVTEGSGGTRRPYIGGFGLYDARKNPGSYFFYHDLN